MCPTLATSSPALGSSLMFSVEMDDGRFWLYASSMGSSFIWMRSEESQIRHSNNREVSDDFNWCVNQHIYIIMCVHCNVPTYPEKKYFAEVQLMLSTTKLVKLLYSTPHTSLQKFKETIYMLWFKFLPWCWCVTIITENFITHNTHTVQIWYGRLHFLNVIFFRWYWRLHILNVIVLRW